MDFTSLQGGDWLLLVGSPDACRVLESDRGSTRQLLPDVAQTSPLSSPDPSPHL